MSKRGLALLIALLLLVGGLSAWRSPTAAAAASVPPGFSLVPTATGQGEYNLTDFVFLPSGGMLTTGKNGRITHVAANGAVSVVTTIGVETYNDLGLLGLAIGPDFADTGWVYVVYNYKVGDRVYGRLSQLTVDNPAAPRSVTREVVVVDGIEHNAPAHTLGQIVVDTDGTIWFGMGDASPYEYHNEFAFRAQDLDQPQGKIFHINPNGSGVPDNPFYNAGAPSSWRSRVWAYGFRNPFRFSLHADGTPYIGDVGWNVIEELSIGVKGGNFGWPCLEGNHRPGGYRDMPRCHAQYAAGGTVAPLWSYDHSIGRSITGGVFATGDAYPEPYRNA